jgi:ubiquitin
MQFADAYIELIEMFPCANRFQLQEREGYFIRTMDCVNKNIAGRTQTEYYEDNKEEINQKQREYYEDHKEEKKQYYEDNKGTISVQQKQYNSTRKEEMKQYLKQYKQNNKKMRRCSCGVEYNDGRTDHRNTHYGSEHHIQFVQDFYERLHQLLNRHTEVE